MSVNEVKLQRAPYEFKVLGTEPHSRTFSIGNEDHTLGNSLRHVLMQNAKVGFAGYSVPHPSEPIVQIRVQTVPDHPPPHHDSNNKNDNMTMTTTTAIEALKEACETLSAQCEFVLEKVEEVMPEVREDRIKMEEILMNDGDYDDVDDNEAELEEDEDDPHAS